jgi:hypothetical protein
LATKQKQAPWDKPNPKGAQSHTKLSPAQKTEAKSRATKAGRPYPNLTDNMTVARKAKSKEGS